MTKIGQGTRTAASDEQGTLAPSWREEGARRNPQKGLKRRSMRCFDCGKEGHMVRDCRTNSKGRRNKFNPNEHKFNMKGNDESSTKGDGKACEAARVRHHEKLDTGNTAKRYSQTREPVVLVDSDASEHGVNDVNIFMLKEQIAPVEVELTSGQVVSAKNRGIVAISIGNTRMTLSNVHYISELHMNLLSCSRIDTNGVTTIIGSETC